MQSRTTAKLVALLGVVCIQACGWSFIIYKRPEFPYSGEFSNSSGLKLAYRIRFPYQEHDSPAKLPLLLYIDGSGPFPLDLSKDQILAHFQAGGFVAAMKQKRGVQPSEGDFAELTYEQRIRDNIDFIHFLLRQYPEIDPSRVFIMGHSEGATIAGAAAFRYRHAAGLIWASSSLDEDFFAEVAAQHPPGDRDLMEQLRAGTYDNDKWQYYSRDWWHQHFNHASLPELMQLTCPIIFLIGNDDHAYASLLARFESMKARGKTDIAFFSARAVAHGTIAPQYQEALLAEVDRWLDTL